MRSTSGGAAGGSRGCPGYTLCVGNAWTPVIWGAMLLLLGAGGYAWGRWKAVLWLAVVPWAIASLGSDAAWWSGLWDRDEEYEPLPLSMFVFPIWIPACCVVVGLGVAIRSLRARARARTAQAPREG